MEDTTARQWDMCRDQHVSTISSQLKPVLKKKKRHAWKLDRQQKPNRPPPLPRAEDEIIWSKNHTLHEVPLCCWCFIQCVLKKNNNTHSVVRSVCSSAIAISLWKWADLSARLVFLSEIQSLASHIRGAFSLIFYLFTFFFFFFNHHAPSCLIWFSVHVRLFEITSVPSEPLNDVEVVGKKKSAEGTLDSLMIST